MRISFDEARFLSRHLESCAKEGLNGSQIDKETEIYINRMRLRLGIFLHKWSNTQKTETVDNPFTS